MVQSGPSFPQLFKTVYEPKFFEAHLSLSDKITAWRTQPVASLQLVTIVLLLSEMRWWRRVWGEDVMTSITMSKSGAFNKALR
ncbi:hypothetical protein [Bradyrhizobium sp. TM239]|uniref:hypothetical protein n=1 Tax=Bradyrhizobium sp. TM239 TaxID=2599802 RepID=UPI0027D6934A|nr:hypothetical protein TM239_04340 [Bradyrhizobium sp. TM239]